LFATTLGRPIAAVYLADDELVSIQHTYFDSSRLQRDVTQADGNLLYLLVESLLVLAAAAPDAAGILLVHCGLSCWFVASQSTGLLSKL
jgi:hypothetical protein